MTHVYRPYHYPPATREDWREHWWHAWRMARWMVVAASLGANVGFVVGRFFL